MSGASTPLDALRETVLSAAGELAGEPPGKLGARGGIVLERPPRADFGDYSTNAALLLAPSVGAPPREVAERLGEQLGRRLGANLERFAVAGPGFLNLFLADRWLAGSLVEVLAAGEAFGAGGAEQPERILVEFVSANPTGPMHVGHARNAAYGDALGRLLAFHGHEVEREFYVNDAGSQVAKLGESILALARGEQVPEDGYRGAYVEQLVHLAARRPAAASAGERVTPPAEGRATVPAGGGAVVPAEGGTTVPVEGEALAPIELGRAAVAVMVGAMQESLAAFNVEGFDHWAYESRLHEGDPSPVAHTLEILEREGHTYRAEGALWLRSTDYGDDKDRVLVRSNGEHTYFASDIAYHQDKRERGFDRQIDVWGADHHGYVARMKAAYQALGGDPEHLELLIMQLVHLMRAGERAQMSKRAGEFVTLDDLLTEIGVDAARWYLLARSHETTVDLDLDLARSQSSENPVYYVQYAHARIAAVLAKAGEERVRAALASVAAGVDAADVDEAAVADVGEAADGDRGQTPLQAAERGLIEQLLAFPEEVREAAERRAPHRITAYALALAQDFTAFYRDCRVVGAEPEAVESLRIALSVATQRTIARCLELLGVSAPAEM
ncbi:MAG TPA: arginine--tRNA ligase [Solirubrobacteraceae bacterium]